MYAVLNLSIFENRVLTGFNEHAQFLNRNSTIYLTNNMTTLLNPKVYIIPSCAVCLDDLTKDLSAADCGHIFHSKWCSTYQYYDLHQSIKAFTKA